MGGKQTPDLIWGLKGLQGCAPYKACAELSFKREKHPPPKKRPKETNICVNSSRVRKQRSARNVSARSFFAPPWGHGRTRVQVIDVRTQMLVFQGFEGLPKVASEKGT